MGDCSTAGLGFGSRTSEQDLPTAAAASAAIWSGPPLAPARGSQRPATADSLAFKLYIPPRSGLPVSASIHTAACPFR